jgi:hypothetical protein
MTGYFMLLFINWIMPRGTWKKLPRFKMKFFPLLKMKSPAVWFIFLILNYFVCLRNQYQHFIRMTDQILSRSTPYHVSSLISLPSDFEMSASDWTDYFILTVGFLSLIWWITYGRSSSRRVVYEYEASEDSADCDTAERGRWIYVKLQ